MSSSLTPQVDIATDHHDRHLWLVKIPNTLAQEWKDLKEGDLDLGTVTVVPTHSTQRGAKRQCTVRVNTDHLAKKTVAREYKLELSEPVQPLRIFSHDDAGRVAFEGVIASTGSLMPEMNLEYRKLLKDRHISSMNTGRTVSSLEEPPRYTKESRMQAHFKFEKLEEEEEKPTILVSNIKGVKMTEEELKTALFHCFEERDLWSLKELNTHVRQPEAHLKKVLKEICDYHRSGPNKNNYELKAQYRDIQKPAE